MCERRPNQYRAGNGPEKHQWFAVQPTEQYRNQTVEEKHAEDPGRDLGLAEAATTTDRENNRYRSRNREQPTDEAIGGVGEPEVAP